MNLRANSEEAAQCILGHPAPASAGSPAAAYQGGCFSKWKQWIPHSISKLASKIPNCDFFFLNRGQSEENGERLEREETLGMPGTGLFQTKREKGISRSFKSSPSVPVPYPEEILPHKQERHILYKDPQTFKSQIFSSTNSN